ncbi:MAG TPA: enoyl-CoA hydratase [Deltaproteobacteria bacterium]|nr:enoyl-CoA hydratase [Deltaproteobacteria bacterium]
MLSFQHETLLIEPSDGGSIVTIRLNRPKALNALNSTLIRQLDLVLEALATHDLRALILTGAGSRAFAAGADIKEMVNHSVDEAQTMSTRGQRTLRRLEDFPAPTIAAVHGFALGGGCELAMCCDIILASTRAVFGQPEVKIGVIPGFGGTQRLVRRVGAQRALELMMSGRNVQADEALRIGLALDVVHGDVHEAALTMARQFASNAPLAVRRVKRAVLDADTLLRAGLANEAELFGACFADDDQREGMVSFIERRPPVYRGR